MEFLAILFDDFPWNSRGMIDVFPVEFALIFPVIFPWNSRVRRSRAQNYANPVSGLSSSTNSGKKSKKNRNRGKQQEKTARNDAFEETVKTPREQNDDNTAQIQCWKFKYKILDSPVLRCHRYLLKKYQKCHSGTVYKILRCHEWGRVAFENH